jgi:predicted Zn-dependent peptidase
VKTESETGKVTVVGKVDPIKVRDNLAEKIKKKVELISPQPKKENGPNNNKSDEKKIDDKKEVSIQFVYDFLLLN